MTRICFERGDEYKTLWLKQEVRIFKNFYYYTNVFYVYWCILLYAILCWQNYLREQPDNIKSVNLVGETTKFLNILYSNISDKSMPLVVQLFDTLVEFTSVSV
jgi:hypothetical protein